ncbi:MAG: hypothetical protein LUE12_07295 [Ruminococcus sp.]|nr:hypothetical protein [Ruminococcus sp.]
MLYLKIIANSFKKHIFINILIIIQFVAVFALGSVMLSAVEEKSDSYKKLESLLDGDGLYCSGYFIDDTSDLGLLTSTNEIKSNLKNVDFIATVNFSSLRTGINSQTNEAETAYALIYDDYSSKLFTPQIKDGIWITDSDRTADIAQAVITENNFGYDKGDVISFETENGTIDVEIIGVIADDEEFLAVNSSYESTEPTYQYMLSRHFSCLNDELENKGYSDEEIAEFLELDGYSRNERVYNQPVLFFLDSEWEKTNLLSTMSDSLFIKYNDNISSDEKLYNRKYVNEQMSVLSFAIRFSQLRKNSKELVYNELYTLLPIMAAVYILVLLGSVSVNAINCKNNMKNYSVLFLCGAKKKNVTLISVIYNALICAISLIIALLGMNLLEVLGLFNTTVISFSKNQLAVYLLIIAVYILISYIVPCAMLTSKKLSGALKLSDE